ncbi:MAG: NAD(P)-dependent oxidoreductase [Pseudomonadota bacterium]
MSQSVGFVGLGVMGFPMAGHLLAAGHDVCVYNRTGAVAERFVAERGGSSCATPADVGARADVVFVCVGNDADVRAVCTGPQGVLAGFSAGKLLVDHTTASAEVAREVASAARALDADFLDAPVSGGQAGAEQGILTVMVGGELAAYERAAPLFDAYARAHRLMGNVGAGQQTKMVNQICIAGVLQGLAEGLNLGRRVGLDIEAVVDVISKGAAQSWQMENRHKTMAAGEYDFGFAVDWMRKDLGIALAAGREVGAALPLTALVDQFYADVQNAGGGRFDTSSLLTRLSG